MTEGRDARDHADVVPLRISESLAPVEVMRTWYRTQVFPRHTHPYFTLGVMLRGVGTLWCGGVSRTLRRGDVVIIAPGDVHTGGLGGNNTLLSYTALHVPIDVASSAAESRGGSSGVGVGMVRSQVIRDAPIAAELRRVDRALSDGDRPAAVTAAVAAIDMLVGCQQDETVDDAPAPRGEPQVVRIARAMIEDCFADTGRTSLDVLAAAAGVTPFHLVREFTRAVGLSPHKYLIQTRVRRATELLAGSVPISDVAATVGFVDQSHLTAHFKRYVGTTPAAYQRGVSGMARRMKSSKSGTVKAISP